MAPPQGGAFDLLSNLPNRLDGLAGGISAVGCFDVASNPRDGSWPHRSHLEFGKISGIIGQQNTSNCRMMNKSTAARAYGIVLATVFAIVVTFVAYRLFPEMNPSAMVPIFIVFWVGFFLTGVWIFTREFPITGAERRRKNKEFYDWLRSQGRR
jgi:hypothetical protein